MMFPTIPHPSSLLVDERRFITPEWYNKFQDAFKLTAASLRERLTETRTYYVRTDGSDTNTGLENTAGGAFLTIQKAINVIAADIDLGGFGVTIQVADGTYAANSTLTLKNVHGFSAAGDIIIKGNAGTPANVVIQAQFISTGLNVIWRVQDCKIGGASQGACILALSSYVQFTNVDFGACTVAQLWVSGGGKIEAVGNYAVSAGSAAHARVDAAGIIIISGRTVTISNTPAFSGAFVFLNVGPTACQCHLMTFSGTGATGARYFVAENSVIYTGGGGSSYLPGDSGGSAITGGQYV